MLCNSKIEMTLMTPQLCRKLVQNLPHMKLKQKIKEREKRAAEREGDKKIKGINIPLKKLAKLSASDILKLIYTMKEKKQEFTLT